MAQNVPGPVAVSRAVAEGARATKIEAPWGDPLEHLCRPWYDELHAKVEVARLDLKSAPGMRRLKELLADADVFLASHRPSALARLALDRDALAGEFPELRHVNIVGDTANPEAPGHDLTYQARAGLLQQAMPLTLLADMAGAERAHAAIKDVMRQPGSSRVVGLFDAMRDLAAPMYHGLTAPGGPLSGTNPAYRIYPTRDGAIAVGALEPHFRARLYEGLGLADGADPAAVFSTRTAAEWEQWAASRDLPLVALVVPVPHFHPAPGMIGDRANRNLRNEVLETAHSIARTFLETVESRHVGGATTAAALTNALGGPLPAGPSDPVEVLQQLAANADAGLVATVGPRYFGFVTGGAVPVTVAADWISSAWDQNGALYVMSPAMAAMEDIVSGWLLQLLGLPPSATVGFTTGCHMANFTCLAAARHEVLRRAGWNVEAQGLQRAPRVRVIAGGEVHISAIGALRYLGFGTEDIEIVRADGQGRMRAELLEGVLAHSDGPMIVCAQAGNVSTGASDPIDAIVEIAHARGAWVHVDGAFGLWAAAVPEMRAQLAGIEHADSWATDAHKWLNVPYDSGLAIVAHPAPHRAAMSMKASYLQRGTDEERIGMDWVPESSRRSRVLPLYALIKTLGRDGIAEMVRRNCALARRMAGRLSAEPGVTILNDVVLNQVLVQFKDDPTTHQVIAKVQAEGTCWAGGAFWQNQQAMRISVSNWSTTDADIDRSADAMLRCYREVVER